MFLLCRGGELQEGILFARGRGLDPHPWQDGMGMEEAEQGGLRSSSPKNPAPRSNVSSTWVLAVVTPAPPNAPFTPGKCNGEFPPGCRLLQVPMTWGAQQWERGSRPNTGLQGDSPHPPAAPRAFGGREVARGPGRGCAVGWRPALALAMVTPSQVLPSSMGWPRHPR